MGFSIRPHAIDGPPCLGPWLRVGGRRDVAGGSNPYTGPWPYGFPRCLRVRGHPVAFSPAPMEIPAYLIEIEGIVVELKVQPANAAGLGERGSRPWPFRWPVAERLEPTPPGAPAAPRSDSYGIDLVA